MVILRSTLIIALCLGTFNLFSQKPKAEKIILDTDFGNDCDDTGALAILHQMAYNGEAEILATMYPMNDELGAPAIDAVNTYYGKPDIPVGTYKGSYVHRGEHRDNYNSLLAQRFPHDLKSGKDAPDAIALYRKVLASQPDNSVTIVVVGPQTLVADLLRSGPDSNSNLDGPALVKKKVKQLVSMGAEHPKGHEWNIKLCPEGAKLVAEKWPTTVVYSGFEIGAPIGTGERIYAEAPSSPLATAYPTVTLDDKRNRNSWDQTAVLFAVRGVKDYWTIGTGTIQIADDGKNNWVAGGNTRKYLIAKKPVPEMKKIIEDMMVAPPKPSK